MQSTVEFQICYPNTNGKHAHPQITHRRAGSYTGYTGQVRDCDAVLFTERRVWTAIPRPHYQSPRHKLRRPYTKRRGELYSEVVVGWICQRRYHNQNLTITFQRSFKPEEMDSINKSISAPLQNDSVFFDGSFLFRTGLYSSLPFTEKCFPFPPVKDRVIRIMRITGPLLPLANSIVFPS